MTIYEQLLINIKYYNSIYKFKQMFNEHTTCDGTALPIFYADDKVVILLI